MRKAFFILPIIAVAATLAHFKQLAFGLTAIVWLVLLFPVFGHVLLSFFSLTRQLSRAEWIVYTTGLSLIGLMIFGLLLNAIGLLTTVPTLTAEIIVPVFSGLLSLLLVLQSLRGKLAAVLPATHTLGTYKQILLMGLPVFFPLLAVIGVVQLNNHTGNAVAIFTVAAIVAYQAYFVFFQKRKTETAIIWNIFCTTLALLLSVSMRSNHLIGFDIQQEFQVFAATLQNGLWYPDYFGTASTYNACLSITILPTLLVAFLPLPPEYIFKFVMQVLFCALPLIVYLIAKHQLGNNRQLAFMATMFFVVQAQFIFQFPALIRQQVALLFFALFFEVAVNRKFSTVSGRILMVILGIGMVLSHYSTAYVCLALLLVITLLRPVYYWLVTRSFKQLRHLKPEGHISPILVGIILLFSFVWYGQILSSSGDITKKITTSLSSLSSFFDADARSDFVLNSLYMGTKVSQETLQLMSKESQAVNAYSNSQYQPQLVESAKPQADSWWQTFVSLSLQAVSLLAKIVLGLGFCYAILRPRIDKRYVEYGLWSLSAVLLLAALVLLPTISREYNVERLYQQLLIILASLSVVSIVALTKKISKKYLAPITFVFVFGYFMSTSGFVNQLAFGVSEINLGNKGPMYDRYYITDAEVASLQWVEQHKNNRSPINFDRYSILQARSHTTLTPGMMRQGMLPPQISKNNYVYASRANMVSGMTFDYYRNQVVTFSFPAPLLDTNKDMIYSNKTSAIYK